MCELTQIPTLEAESGAALLFLSCQDGQTVLSSTWRPSDKAGWKNRHLANSVDGQTVPTVVPGGKELPAADICGEGNGGIFTVLSGQNGALPSSLACEGEGGAHGVYSPCWCPLPRLWKPGSTGCQVGRGDWVSPDETGERKS